MALRSTRTFGGQRCLKRMDRSSALGAPFEPGQALGAHWNYRSRTADDSALELREEAQPEMRSCHDD